jgi:hypothetical protein
MAQMYPEIFPGNFEPENPEFVVYQVLRKLPSNYHVFYSKRLRGLSNSRAECEIDFIVSNQRDVIICLEVKGGLLSYDGVADAWTQNGKRMDVNPNVQAQSACHTLLKLMSKELGMVNVDWALCFPQCCMDSSAGTLSVDREQVIDEHDLSRIEEAVHVLEERVRRRFSKAGFSGGQFKRFVEILTRSIGFVQILGVRIAREAEQLIQITEEQCDVLNDVEINPKMLIHGYAGTGKTILAQTFAKRLAENEKRVLLLFYNKGIASTVRYAFDRHGTVEVGTFSSFAKRLVQRDDPDWWESHPRTGDDFWRLELPSHLFDIPRERLPQFDAIIVDEGQDFKPEWFEFLQLLLVPGEDTHFTVFLDEHQDIFNHWKHFPCSPPPARKVLTKNCRNTRKIIDCLKTSYPTEMTPFEGSPSGTPVIVRETKGDVDEQTQIVRDVKHLISADQVLPGSIVILLHGDKRESCLNDVKSIGGFPLESTYERYDPRARKVYYSQISIFKGLEADVVLLILGPELSDEAVAKAIYVQGSRAKHVLFIYRRKASTP